jgi:dipeptidyl-peptidase-4
VLATGTRHGALRARVYESGIGGPEGATEAAFQPDASYSVGLEVDPSGTWGIVTYSNACTPPRRELRRLADGEVVRSLSDARTAEAEGRELAVPEWGTLDFPEGPVDYCLWKPARLDPGTARPLIVQVYGGPGSRMVRDTWGGIVFASYFTARGYLVLHADGRGSGGRGAARERTVHGRLGILELEDQARAVRALAARPYVDGGRVGITGWSYGGTLTCLALTRKSDLFKAGVAVAPVTDWRLYDTIYTERYMGLPAANGDGYAETAATQHAGTMNGRLLLLHGTGDDNVHAQNTLQLVNALLQAGKSDFEVMLYPRRGHGLGDVRLDVYRRMAAVFDGL